MNLTNEQIARVFAMYWGCDCLRSMYGGEQKRFEIRDKIGRDNITWRTDHLQILLTPLSAISDEDAIEVRKILGKESVDKDYIKWILYENFKDFPIGSSFLSIHFANQYLISKGYAIPLFIEVGHPDNGKDAIQLGLAIDKTVTNSLNQ